MDWLRTQLDDTKRRVRESIEDHGVSGEQITETLTAAEHAAAVSDTQLEALKKQHADQMREAAERLGTLAALDLLELHVR